MRNSLPWFLGINQVHEGSTTQQLTMEMKSSVQRDYGVPNQRLGLNLSRLRCKIKNKIATCAVSLSSF